jgi:hypothetical protein
MIEDIERALTEKSFIGRFAAFSDGRSPRAPMSPADYFAGILALKSEVTALVSKAAGANAGLEHLRQRLASECSRASRAAQACRERTGVAERLLRELDDRQIATSQFKARTKSAMLLADRTQERLEGQLNTFRKEQGVLAIAARNCSNILARIRKIPELATALTRPALRLDQSEQADEILSEIKSESARFSGLVEALGGDSSLLAQQTKRMIDSLSDERIAICGLRNSLRNRRRGFAASLEGRPRGRRTKGR